MMSYDERDWRSTELTVLSPEMIVPSAVKEADYASTNRHFAHQPHALSVDFQYLRSDSVSPCSEISLASQCSLVSLSPSLFPLPPTGSSPPTTSHSIAPSSPPGTARSQASLTSWFSPPSPPPCTPLPPTPTQKKLASLIVDKNGFENIQIPANAKIKSPLAGMLDTESSFLVDTPPQTPPRRTTNYNVDSRGNRESVVDPDAPLSPPPLSLPPPYSPGFYAADGLSRTSMANSRVDPTEPLVYHQTNHSGSPRNPTAEREARNKRGDVEAGGAWHWQTKPKRRKRQTILAAVGAASAALLMVIAGVVVGIYLAVSGSTSI
ncbi:hypothetical protein GGR54DRAFT_215318 [Hypoxylon sp. NC1633]|nr:hypothetical protein GGR54DRAFT_215318 [Hypoxylon sp. NC1633]